MARLSGIRAAVMASVLAGALAEARPAIAHPHVTVSARSAFVFDAGGKLTGVRHAWTFDEAYSAFAIADFKLDRKAKLTREQLGDLARLNVESLGEFGYFTSLKQGKTDLKFDKPAAGYYLEHDGETLTLHFVLPLKSATAPGKSLSLRVDDETYFVAFAFGKGEAVTTEGASGACKVEMKRPQAGAGDKIPSLSEDFFNTMKSGFTDQFVTSVSLNCP